MYSIWLVLSTYRLKSITSHINRCKHTCIGWKPNYRGNANKIPLSWSSEGTLTQYGCFTGANNEARKFIYLNRAEEARCMVLINDSAHHV